MVFVGICIAFIIFSIVVLIHEYGHFSAARFFGVKVEEFGLGIPPRAKKLWRDTKGTLFSLNWLPLGGFVKIAGENPHAFLLYSKKGKKLSEKQIVSHIKKQSPCFDKTGKEIPKKDMKIIGEKIAENHANYNLSNKPAWQQSIVILAGVFMNFLLAVVIFSGLFFFGVQPIGINDTIPIQTQLKLIPTLEQAKEAGILTQEKGVYLFPIEDSLAEKSGIQEGDLLLRINDANFQTLVEVQSIISNNAGKSLEFYIKREQLCPTSGDIPEVCPIVEYMEKTVFVGEDGKIGSYLSENISVNQDFVYQYGIGESVKYGVLETYGHITLTFKALGMLGGKIFFPETETDRQEAMNQLSGPIGIVDFISDSLSAGIIFLILIGAIISVNLGVFNLLPIPALDGGRFVFIIVNALFSKITGKKGIPQNIEATIHVIFFITLIALSFVIAYNDIVKIINR